MKFRKPYHLAYGLTTLNEPKVKGGYWTGECVHKLLFYMVVSASGELKKMNVVILLIICKHTLFSSCVT